MEKSRQWALRCVHEAQMHEANSFITLTYDAEHLPGDGSLDVRDWQLFAKKLRNKAGKFRFFHCGEYGDENGRPHYHACLFGIDFFGDRSLWKENNGFKLYRSELLEDAWGKGFCSIGDLTYESAAYVSRYVMKKVTGKLADKHYERFDPDTGEVRQLRPEYTTMSRRPGIGTKWFEKFGAEVYPSDEVVIDGRRFRPPRFYDEKLEEEALKIVKGKRQRNVESRGADLTPERLLVREEVLERKLDGMKREV